MNNILNSSSLSEVNNYTSIEAKSRNTNEKKFFDFYSLDDLKYANEWPHENFGYSINEFGFRIDDMKNYIDVAAFGCSFTFGLGLPNHMLWHQFLAEKLNTQSYNFGVAGASIKTILDIFLIVSKHIQFDKAVLLLPSLHRLQVAKTDPLSNDIKYLSIIPGVKSELANFFGIDYDGIFKSLPDEEIVKNVKEQIYLLDMMSKIRNIKTYVSSWDPDTYELLSNLKLDNIKLLPVWFTPVELIGDVGRDKSHPGIKHHTFFADRIIDFIK